MNGFRLKPIPNVWVPLIFVNSWLRHLHLILFFLHSLSITVFIYTEFPNDTYLSWFLPFDLHAQPIAVYSVPPNKSFLGLFCVYFFARFFVLLVYGAINIILSTVVMNERLSPYVYITCRTAMLEKLPHQQLRFVHIPAKIFNVNVCSIYMEISSFDWNFYTFLCGIKQRSLGCPALSLYWLGLKLSPR